MTLVFLSLTDATLVIPSVKSYFSCTGGGGKKYGMCTIVGAPEVYHAVQAGEGCAATLIPMRIQLFLGQNIATGLR